MVIHRDGHSAIGIRTRVWRRPIPPSPLVLIDFLFATLARKVPPIGLREGAAVARYLNWLSWEAGPGSKSLNPSEGFRHHMGDTAPTGRVQTCREGTDDRGSSEVPFRGRLLAIVLSSATQLVEIIPGSSRTRFRDRAETVRLHRGIGVHLHPGILFGFTPEHCSESSRNRVHVPPDSPSRLVCRLAARIRYKLACRNLSLTPSGN